MRNILTYMSFDCKKSVYIHKNFEYFGLHFSIYMYMVLHIQMWSKIPGLVPIHFLPFEMVESTLA